MLLNRLHKSVHLDYIAFLGLHYTVDCCQIRNTEHRHSVRCIISMNTAGVIGCASECRISMQIKLHALINNKTRYICSEEKWGYHICYSYIQCIVWFSQPRFQKRICTVKCSIHIFRGFQKKKEKMGNPVRWWLKQPLKMSSRWWAVSCWSITLYNPNVWWVSVFFLLHQRFHKTVSFSWKTVMYYKILVRNVNWRVDNT